MSRKSTAVPKFNSDAAEADWYATPQGVRQTQREFGRAPGWDPDSLGWIKNREDRPESAATAPGRGQAEGDSLHLNIWTEANVLVSSKFNSRCPHPHPCV